MNWKTADGLCRPAARGGFFFIPIFPKLHRAASSNTPDLTGGIVDYMGHRPCQPVHAPAPAQIVSVCFMQDRTRRRTRKSSPSDIQSGRISDNVRRAGRAICHSNRVGGRPQFGDIPVRVLAEPVPMRTMLGFTSIE